MPQPDEVLDRNGHPEGNDQQQRQRPRGGTVRVLQFPARIHQGAAAHRGKLVVVGRLLIRRRLQLRRRQFRRRRRQSRLLMAGRPGRTKNIAMQYRGAATGDSMQQLVTIAILALALQPAAARPAPNTLTASEKTAGWRLLFDGRTLDGWRGYRRNTAPEAGWKIEDGTLRTVAKVKGADIITTRSFNDFELSWEWRVAPAGNNGVKYFVTEDRPQSPGHEYQMIDDAKYPGKLKPEQLTGAFYDVLP